MATTWRERVANTTEPLEYFTGLAQSWQTCAVGEQRNLHPDVIRMRPIYTQAAQGPEDEELLALGTHFYGAVLDGDRYTADRILDRIEDRVLALKRNMQKGESSC